jgi:predicted nuclease of predicted toxin-antitoxin system
MKFLVDMPLSPALARWLNASGHDAVHAITVGLERAEDSAILERARQEGRVVVTADLDYPRLLALSRAPEPGIILFRGGSYSESQMLDLLKSVLENVAVEELPGLFVVVERGRIRKRGLPLR